MGFIEEIKNYAIEDYKTSGVFPSITIAQAILESGWGKSDLAKLGKNLFGIKRGSWRGECITFPTKEFIKGQWITVNAEFRKYENYGQSIKDHSDLLQQSFYSPVLNAKNYKIAAEELQKCGYATDPNYANLLIQIIEENNLQSFDNIHIEEKKSYEENGNATVTTEILFVRSAPSRKSVIVGYYEKGDSFYYDSVFISDGYYWTSYVSYSGERRYVASRKVDNSEIYLKCK